MFSEPRKLVAAVERRVRSHQRESEAGEPDFRLISSGTPP